MKISKDFFDQIQSLAHAYIDLETGKEILNPIPKELAGGLERPPTLQERVQKAIASELSRQADLQNYETLRDANTFDLEDEFTVRMSGYEWEDAPEMPPDPELPDPIVTEPEPEPTPTPDPEPTPET